VAKFAWNFTLQSTPRENTKLKCSKISALQNREIMTMLKCGVLQYRLGPMALRGTSSQNSTLLSHNTFGDRNFAVAGPRVWNSLPAHLRDKDITYGGFRRELKHFVVMLLPGCNATCVNCAI